MAEKEEKMNNNRPSPAEAEENVLRFWNERKIFQKSLEKKSPRGNFIFYDGPPFASGLPHYGHILAGTIKDVIPRYKTMLGFHVARRWGWDCHGLPVENLVEKELGLAAKKDIVSYGLEKFNAAARENVLRFTDDWKKIIPRLGRFVDMEHDYRTMDSRYTESVWWVFQELHKKGLIYEGFKSMHLCPHCETTLSNFEVSQGYKIITDIAVTVKFQITNTKFQTNSKSDPLKGGPNSKTYLLAWTTTPWTLPGNVALAVNPNFAYIRVRLGEASYILAKERFNKLKEIFFKEAEVVDEFPGKRLIGLSYEPLFDYYQKARMNTDENNTDESGSDSIRGYQRKNPRVSALWKNGWKVYAAPFVTTEDGTGIVHIAPAFGEDDYNLSLKEKLPFIQHVGTDGKFKKEVADFVGLPVKPRSDDPKGHQVADVAIIKNLAARNLLFAKEPVKHSYPHCWRCDTPLLNYAASSWFVKVSSLKDKLVAENRNITWVPDDIRDGRFGNWLMGARDWAISRSRFWGAPIPVWRCQKCGKIEIVGDTDNLRKRLPSKNSFIAIRHGEADNNVFQVTSGLLDTPHHLTALGRKEVLEAARKLKEEKIDLMFYSPLVRTRETAEILAKELGLTPDKVFSDLRIREVQHGNWEGKPLAEFQTKIGQDSAIKRFSGTIGGVESFDAIKRRMMEFLFEADERWTGKKILIVSHDNPIFLMLAGAEGLSNHDIADRRKKDAYAIDNASIHNVPFSYIPRNENLELDLHRPFIDSAAFVCPCGGRMERVPEVFDCWFESGGMPYGQVGYKGRALPDFDPRGGLFKKPKGYPAEFIAEGLDQTRGWFYSMLVLGVALFGRTPYRNVIVNGIVLAEDGEKMSKKLKNYPDPMDVVKKYGADALRFYLLSSGVVRGQDLRFSESGVAEVMRKNILRLKNVLAFYELYKEQIAAGGDVRNPTHVLDRWILARLNGTTAAVTVALERYELDRASWPISDFIDDLSTWYLRRSRERFKESAREESPILTLRFVLREFSKLLAPFMPFIAEELFQRVKGEGVAESVHLESWPASAKASAGEARVISYMIEVRKIVSLGLEARSRANIKVRQPLAALKIRNPKSEIRNNSELLLLVKDEVNVKEILFDGTISEEAELDSNLTPELREEGRVREIIRALQGLRKTAGLTPGDEAVVSVETDSVGRTFLKKHEKEIAKTTTVSSFEYGNVPAGSLVVVEDLSFRFEIKKK